VLWQGVVFSGCEFEAGGVGGFACAHEGVEETRAPGPAFEGQVLGVADFDEFFGEGAIGEVGGHVGERLEGGQGGPGGVFFAEDEGFGVGAFFGAEQVSAEHGAGAGGGGLGEAEGGVAEAVLAGEVFERLITVVVPGDRIRGEADGGSEAFDDAVGEFVVLVAIGVGELGEAPHCPDGVGRDREVEHPGVAEAPVAFGGVLGFVHAVIEEDHGGLADESVEHAVVLGGHPWGVAQNDSGVVGGGVLRLGFEVGLD
jgi:hypothetical protein